jgi:uroporphyrinogen decarboxylase
MIINMKEWQRTIIASKDVKALPIMTYPGLHMTGHTIMDVITNGEKQFDCMKALTEEYPSVASVAMMDLSVEAEVFGSQVLFAENEVPTVIGQCVANMKSALSLPVPKVGSGRTGVYLKATELAAQQIRNKPVFGGLIGPFSLTGRLLEMKNLLLNTRRQPEMVHVVLQKQQAFS